MSLETKANVADPDGFYQELIESQRGLDEGEAELMNCKLVLILANQVGDRDVLREAIKHAGGKRG